MKVGPKYKIARRLGAHVFEKTQTEKFALSEARRGALQKGKIGKAPRRGGSDFGAQLLEKQRVRMTYGITERQFARYVKEAAQAKEVNSADRLFQILESRLDAVAYRLGFAPTRRAARQLATHGHLTVNGKRMDVPSHQVKVSDVIAIRDGSKSTGLFTALDERLERLTVPSWLSVDSGKRQATMITPPTRSEQSDAYDLTSVIEFYSR